MKVLDPASTFLYLSHLSPTKKKREKYLLLLIILFFLLVGFQFIFVVCVCVVTAKLYFFCRFCHFFVNSLFFFFNFFSFLVNSFVTFVTVIRKGDFFCGGAGKREREK